MAEKPISPNIEYASINHPYLTSNCSHHAREPSTGDWLDDGATRLVEFTSFARWPPRSYDRDAEDGALQIPAPVLLPPPPPAPSSKARNAGSLSDEHEPLLIDTRSTSTRVHLPPKKRTKASSSSSSSASSKMCRNSTALQKRNSGTITDICAVTSVMPKSDQDPDVLRPESTQAFAEKHRRGPSNTSHPCPECHKVFGSSGKLQQHQFVHSGERPFVCDECSKGFSSRFKLMRHALIHAPPGERRYKCSCCERSFHRKDHLKNHAHVHDPQKVTYKCHECPKEYNSRLSYRKHVAVHAAHSGDLECKVCLKRFASTDELVFHLKVHSGSRTIKTPSEKKFKCDFCERRFFTRKDVKRHLVVHTGRRDFLCQLCPQRFGRKDHLVRHIKKSHHEHHRYHHQQQQQQQQHLHHHHHHHVHSNSHYSLSDKEAVGIDGSATIDEPDHQIVSNASDLRQLSSSSSLDLVLRAQPFCDGQCDTSVAASASTSTTATAISLMPTVLATSTPPTSSAAFGHDMEYRLYEGDIKIERDNDDVVDPIDIGQLFGLLPLSTPTSPPSHLLHQYHQQQLHLQSLSSTTVIQSMSSTDHGVMLPPHIVTTEHEQEHEEDNRALPQFDQAFQ